MAAMQKPGETQQKGTEDLLRRPLYLYDLPKEVLDSLAFKESQDADLSEASQAPNAESSPAASTETSGGAQSCSLCSVAFSGIQEQKSHRKSDLHNYNTKQRSRGEAPVTEAEFESLIEGLDESLSGSDDSEDDEEDDSKEESTLTALLKKQATLAARKNGNAGDGPDEQLDSNRPGTGKQPLLWFSSPVLPENTYFGVYRAIFGPEELKNEAELTEVVRKKQLAPVTLPKANAEGTVTPATQKGPHMFLCMIGGGHFAAMVVSLAPRKQSKGPMNKEATVLAHKTFHRYTTRRKQGGSQSANDNAKGNAHSAGSSIRRYNEQALVDEVRLLLQEWKGLLDTAELLFIRASGPTNRRTLFGPYEGQVLRANDPRIRGFPFNTRRATQNELMRSFIELTRLKVRDIEPVASTKAQSEASKRATSPKPSKPAAPKLTEEEETALLHTSQLQAFVKRSKMPALLTYLQKNELSPDFLFQPADQNLHAPTLLHLSASQNAAPLVAGLLGKAGANPTVENAHGKTAFELAGDRATRDAFRVARDELGERKWDWEAARVPPAMKREAAEERSGRERQETEKKEAERRRAEEDRLRAEGPKVGEGSKKPAKGVMETVDRLKSAQDKRAERARGMSEEAVKKVEREQRARAAEARLRRMQGGQ